MSPTLLVRIFDDITEFCVVDHDRVTSFSVPVGATQLSADELTSDPPRAEELSNAIASVSTHIDDVLRELPQAIQCDIVRSSSATLRTMAAVERGDGIDHIAPASFQLSRQAAEDVYRTLATEKLADRVYNPGLPALQASTVVGGCCIVVAVMRRFHLTSIEVTTDDGWQSHREPAAADASPRDLQQRGEPT